jgi:hypothetical protein
MREELISKNVTIILSGNHFIDGVVTTVSKDFLKLQTYNQLFRDNQVIEDLEYVYVPLKSIIMVKTK